MSSIPITLTMQGIPPREEKFCIKCAHLLGNRHYTENWQDWKCGKTKEQTGVNPVNGEPIIKAYFCTAMREIPADCGPEGKWYEEYKQPAFLEQEAPRTLGKIKKVTEDDLRNL